LQRVQSSYQRLSAIAANLNTASDQLTQSVAALDDSIKRLNLGISSWYQFEGDSNDDGAYWRKYIGYARVDNKWGIALRKTKGHHDFPELADDDQWLFKDAPRQLRIEAVEHIPAMIDSLIGDAERAIERITAKTAEAKHLAEALAPPEPAKPRKISTSIAAALAAPPVKFK